MACAFIAQNIVTQIWKSEVTEIDWESQRAIRAKSAVAREARETNEATQDEKLKN